MERLLLLRLAFLAVCVCAASAIQCYVCNSKEDHRCGESFHNPPDLLKSCPLGSTHCGKSNRTIDDGDVQTTRSCASGTDLEIKMSGCIASKVVDFTAVCNKDACNGASL